MAMADQAPAPQNDFDPSKQYVWIKGLESKVNSLLREIELLKNDFLKKNNQMTKDLKILTTDLVELKHEQEKTLQKMDLVIRELRKTAGIEEVQTMKKYLDFWNPMHFVTQRDLERAIDAKLAEAKGINTSKETQKKGDNDVSRSSS